MTTWKKITTPRWLPFILACFTISFIFYFLNIKLNKLFINSGQIENFFIDDSSYVSFQARHHQASTSIPTVVLIGGSVTREATIEDHQFKEHIQNTYRKEINFLNLGSSDQTLMESAALLKTLNLAAGSIVFIQMSFKKLNYSYNEYRGEYLNPKLMLLDYSMFSSLASYGDYFIRALTPNILLFRNPLQHRYVTKKCFYSELLTITSNCYTPAPIQRHFYTESNRMSTTEKQKYAEDIKLTVLPEYLKHGDFSVNIIEKITQYLSSRKVTTVLIEYPVSPIEFTLNNTVRSNTNYHLQLATLQKNATYLDWLKTSTFNDNDFRDTQHMVESGKLKMSKLIANKIALIINNKGSQ